MAKKIDQLKALLDEGVLNALTRDLQAELAQAFPITTEVIGSIVSDFQKGVGSILKTKRSNAHVLYMSDMGNSKLPSADKLAKLKFEPISAQASDQVETSLKRFTPSVQTTKTRVAGGMLIRLIGTKRITGGATKTAPQDLANFILNLEKISKYVHVTVQEKQSSNQDQEQTPQSIIEYRVVLSYLMAQEQK